MTIGIQAIREMSRQNAGENFTYLAGDGTEIPVIQNLDDVQFLLKDSDGQTRKELPWLRRAIGPSRVTENGARWQVSRNVSQRHYTHFDRDLMRAIIPATVDLLATPGTPPPVALGGFALYRMVIDVFCRMFFGTSLEQSGINANIVRKMAGYAAYTTYMPAENIYTSPPAARAEMLANMVKDRASLIAQVRRMRETCWDASPLIRDIAKAEAEHSEFVFEQELLSLISGAADSSAATLGWVLYFLSHDPQFQAMCTQFAQTGTLGGEDSEATIDGDPIDFLIDEALRQFPSFLLLSRIANVDIEISDRVLRAEKGFMLNLMGHSRRDHFGFGTPLTQLFSDAKSATATAGPNLAFGGGRRICGGVTFAKMELRLLTAEILRRYRVIPTDAAQDLDSLTWQLSMVPSGDFAIALMPHDAATGAATSSE